jgi:hypothetical protein
MARPEHWSDFQRYVFDQFEKNNDLHREHAQALSEITAAITKECGECKKTLGERIARVEVKSSMWGFIGGIFSGILMIFTKR